jgi:hypothetical protein
LATGFTKVLLAISAAGNASANTATKYRKLDRGELYGIR